MSSTAPVGLQRHGQAPQLAAMDLELLQRKVDELIALAAILGPQLTAEDVEPPELWVDLAEAAFEASSHGHLAGAALRLTLALALLPPAGRVPAGSANGQEWQARLHLMLPPGYPAQEAVQIEAVACVLLGRGGELECAAQLQAAADAAAADGGQECLYQLAEALLQRVQEAAKEEDQQLVAGAAGQGHGESSWAAAAGQAAQGAQAQEGCHLALLRLHHMHDRPSYSRTVRRWARELGLGGHLLFCSGGGGGGVGGCGSGRPAGSRAPSASPPIILILLEGSEAGVKEYLVRQRTRNVDVDSKGRACRERMMTVVALQRHTCSDQLKIGSGSSCDGGKNRAAAAAGGNQSPSGSAVPESGSSSSSGGVSSSAGPGLLFEGEFGEQEVGVPQLAALLARCGLDQHWRAATGLPGPPPSPL